jgi:mono/diheme cytochrome c family protein
MNQEQRTPETIWPMFVFFGVVGVVLWGIFAMQPPAKTSVVSVEPTATPEIVAEAPTEVPLMHLGMPVTGDPKAGEVLFQTVCAACHGFNAQGISGLGKPLVGSEFVNKQADTQLVAFIKQGRLPSDPLNTTGQMMPPRGGSVTITDDDLNNVVAYLRLLNRQGGVIAAESTPVPQTTVAEVRPFAPPPINALDASVVPPSLGASGVLDLSLNDGQSVYLWTCSSCHGADGRGIAGFGTDISAVTIDDTVLAETFIQVAPYSIGTGAFIHPFRGGYPQLSDEQVNGLVEYLHTLTGN